MPIMDENDVSLPKATLSKMIREFMPADLRLAGDTMDMLIECCTEFVSLVSSESNDVSNREKRNTIHPEHVLRALRELGLQEFVKEVTNTWEAWKEESKCRPTGTHKPGNRKTAADAAGLTEEEQIALQQQLFAAARRSFQLPEANSEAGLSPGATTPDGTGFPTPEQAGPHVGVLQSHGYLGHPMMSPAVQSSGFVHMPQYPAQAPHLGGVFPPHQYGYPSSGGEGQMPSHGADVKPEMIDGHGQSAAGVYYSTQGGSVPNEPAEPASRYGADVLPIPPLQVQPIPSAFHPAANESRLSGPSLLSVSHPQSSVSSQGAPQQSASTPPQQAGQPMFLMRPAAFVSPSAPAEPVGNVQTVWTHAVPQGLPELQLSQPVVVIHNGVQHFIPLQTLLSQVGGLQQFRVGPVPQQQQQHGNVPKPAAEDPRCPTQADVQISTSQEAAIVQPHQQDKEEEQPATKFAEPSLVSTSTGANAAMEEGSSQPDLMDASTGQARSGQVQGESGAELPAMPLQPTQPMLVPLGLIGASPKADAHGAVASMERMFETNPSAARVPLEPFQVGATLISRGPVGEIPPLNSMTMMPPAIIGHSTSPPTIPPRDHLGDGSCPGAVHSAQHPSLTSSPQGLLGARFDTSMGNLACVGPIAQGTTGMNGSSAGGQALVTCQTGDLSGSLAPPRSLADVRVVEANKKTKQGVKRGREDDSQSGGGEEEGAMLGEGASEEERQKRVRRKISASSDPDLPVSDVDMVDRTALVKEISRDIANQPPSIESSFTRKDDGCEVVGRVEQQQ